MPSSPIVEPSTRFAIDTSQNGDGADRFDARGWSGLRRWGGRIDEAFLRELSGPRGIKTFKEMEQTDPVVGVGLLTTQMMIRSVQWGVEPASDKGEDKANAEYVEECMHDMDHGWDDMIDEALSMLPYGWAMHEIVFKLRNGPDQKDRRRKSRYRDGRLGLRSVRLRGQDTLDRWQWDDEGDELLGMWQHQEMFTPVFLPLAKCVHFRTSKHKDNPEGRSILVNAYRPWRFKREMEVIEGIGIEREMVGVPKMEVPIDVLADDATGAAKAMREYLERVLGDLKADERSFVIVPNEDAGYSFDLVQSGGTRQLDIDPVIARKNREISFAMLMDFLLLGHEKVGTQALAGTKVDVYKTAIHGWVEALEDAVNNQLVPRLFDVQGEAPDELPQIKGGKVSTLDVTGKMDILERLARTGSFGFEGPPLEITNEILRDADLPQLEKEPTRQAPTPNPGDQGL